MFNSLTLKTLKAGEVLYEGGVGQALEFIYFPITAVTAMVTPLSDGDSIETLPVGYEGIAAFEAVFQSGYAQQRWICSVSGRVARMRVLDFWRFTKEIPQFGRTLLCYGQSVMACLAQSVACNAKHPLAQRCAKWFLLTSDRSRDETFEITHDFLSSLLGARRAGVTGVVSAFRKRGFLRTERGRIIITDRVGLLSACCECYVGIAVEFHRLMLLSQDVA